MTFKTYLMKPYPQRNLGESKRIYNYRTSRARRVIENVFGILYGRFRIFQSPINMEPEGAVTMVQTCIVLHNMLRKFDQGNLPNEAMEEMTTNVAESRGLRRLAPTISRNPSHAAKRVRDEFNEYFMSEGEVPWQRAMANLD